jgi:hypothetical protein
LNQHEAMLTRLATPVHPITETYAASHLDNGGAIVAHAQACGIDWPTHDSVVPVRLGSSSRRFFLGDAHLSDTHFVDEARHGHNDRKLERGFNNFCAIIGAKPFKPESAAEIQQAARRIGPAFFASKPYLLRAHLLAPEFMGGLQQAVEQCGGMSEWTEAIIQGGLAPDVFPQHAALLRSSRLAYGLLTNLMRTDDLQRQSEWLGFGPNAPLIDDAEKELWT